MGEGMAYKPRVLQLRNPGIGDTQEWGHRRRRGSRINRHRGWRWVKGRGRGLDLESVDHLAGSKNILNLTKRDRGGKRVNRGQGHGRGSHGHVSLDGS